MATFLAQNQFNSEAHVPVASGSGAANAQPPSTAAPAPILDQTNFIPEIFHFVRKLMKDDHRFVLDEAAFMAAIDEAPLFLRAE